MKRLLGGALVAWPLMGFLAVLGSACWAEPLLLAGLGIVLVGIVSLAFGICLLTGDKR